MKAEGARSWEDRVHLSLLICDIHFKGTVVSETHRLEHKDRCPNYAVCVCVLADADGRRVKGKVGQVDRKQ